MIANHPSATWRLHWTVDLDDCTARHLDGWVMKFKLADGGGIDGDLVGLPCPITTEHMGQAGDIAQQAAQVYQEARDRCH